MREPHFRYLSSMTRSQIDFVSGTRSAGMRPQMRRVAGQTTSAHVRDMLYPWLFLGVQLPHRELPRSLCLRQVPYALKNWSRNAWVSCRDDTVRAVQIVFSGVLACGYRMRWSDVVRCCVAWLRPEGTR